LASIAIYTCDDSSIFKITMTTALHHIPHRTKKLPPLRVGMGGPVGSGCLKVADRDTPTIQAT
jgi:hypothetical protein